MKSITSKLLTISFVIIFATGCATVTDANLDLPDAEEPTVETTSTDGSFWNSNGDDMDPIIDRPRAGGTLED